MIIKTRFRDIPWEEAQKCLTPLSVEQGKAKGRSWTRDLRGKSVEIIVPAVPFSIAPCEGPYYALADNSKETVCPHIAEIGD